MRGTTHRGPLRVGIEATALLDARTGVGTFVWEVVHGLACRPGAVAVTAFAVSLRGHRRFAAEVPDGVRVAARPVSARGARAAWARGADHPSGRGLAGPVDVVHGPNFVVPPGGGAAEVVTVHDLTAVRYPELCTPDVRAWPGLLARAVERGAWVHTVSEAVAAEVRDLVPAAADRVVAIPNGLRPPGPATPGSDAATGHRLAGGDRYVLALGTVEPRKDLPSLVRAFDALAADDPDLRLVVAGPDGWAAPELTAAREAARHGRRIVRLGWVDDHQRAALLRGASVVAYPSRYEGFGLVPLEALAVGTPVVATTVPALEEVLGDAAALVPVGDADALAEAIHRTAADEAERTRRLAAGAERVARYRWDDTVTGLLALYRRAATSR